MGRIPQILNMHFQIASTCEHVAGFGWVPFSELRVQLTTKRQENRGKAYGQVDHNGRRFSMDRCELRHLQNDVFDVSPTRA